MTVRRASAPAASGAEETAPTTRIGEVAKLCGVTTRTLRYWEEIGLLAPSAPRLGSERVYARSEVERAQRIRELQAIMGFSLAEIGAVLETEDVLDKLRSAYKASARPEHQRDLLANAMEANDKLVARLDDTLDRIRAFRDERVAKAGRLRARAAELDREIGAGRGPKRR
jgi:DNA-binding transcriptional MerR regulator